MNFEDLIAKVKTCGKQKLAVAAAQAGHAQDAAAQRCTQLAALETQRQQCAELETALPGPPRARTTLLTLLARLEEKGCVTREKQGRGYLYTAALTRAAYLPAESRNLWGRLFGGSPRNFVAALAETDTLTDADIDELAEYLEELKKERK